jgi:hypothetical protein
MLFPHLEKRPFKTTASLAICGRQFNCIYNDDTLILSRFNENESDEAIELILSEMTWETIQEDLCSGGHAIPRGQDRISRVSETTMTPIDQPGTAV